MQTFLIGLMYHEPESWRLWNAGVISDYESSTGVFVDAQTEQDALAWGSKWQWSSCATPTTTGAPLGANTGTIVGWSRTQRKVAGRTVHRSSSESTLVSTLTMSRWARQPMCAGQSRTQVNSLPTMRPYTVAAKCRTPASTEARDAVLTGTLSVARALGHASVRVCVDEH